MAVRPEKGARVTLDSPYGYLTTVGGTRIANGTGGNVCEVETGRGIPVSFDGMDGTFNVRAHWLHEESTMSRPTQEPTKRPGTLSHVDSDSATYEHPAFGQIGAARVTGDTTLYGSDFVHHHYVTIRISRSRLHRDLSRDWHTDSEQLIEVALSEAQWATFVSSMNIGGGVPCTLDWIAGEGLVPGIPLRMQDDAFRSEASATARTASERVRKAIAEVEGIVGAGLSKPKRDAILKELRQLDRDLRDRLPFVVKSHAEYMEATVEKAKIEVNAYVQQSISRAGLAVLGEASALLQLGAGPETEGD